MILYVHMDTPMCACIGQVYVYREVLINVLMIFGVTYIFIALTVLIIRVKKLAAKECCPLILTPISAQTMA